MKRRGKAVVAIVVRAGGRRRLRIGITEEEPAFVVTIEGEAVTVDGSNLTLSEA